MKKPTYYIASGLENVEQVRQVKARLDAAGWKHTYDWTVHGSVQREGIARLREVAAAEADGILQAGVIVVLLPGGRGTHAELGMAIMAVEMDIEPDRTRVCIYSPNPDKDFNATDGTTCAFYYHPRVERFCGSLDGVIDIILGVES